MPFCANCGSSVEGRFCPKCGTPIAGGPDPGGAPPPPPPAGGGGSGLSENAAGALCYLFGLITGILFLVMAPYNQSRNVRFHAFQSILFSIAWVVIAMVLGIILPWRLWFMLGPLFNLAFLALWLFLMWQAYNNKKFKLPVLGDIAEKQA